MRDVGSERASWSLKVWAASSTWTMGDEQLQSVAYVMRLDAIFRELSNVVESSNLPAHLPAPLRRPNLASPEPSIVSSLRSQS